MRISGNQEIYHRYNIFSEGLRLPPGHAGGGAHGGGLLPARPPLVRRRHRPLPRTRRQPQDGQPVHRTGRDAPVRG